jgi:N-acetylmuramoyl-L-alanine amidase
MSEDFNHERFMRDLSESFATAREIIQMPADELETAFHSEPENVAKIVTVLYIAQAASELVAAIADRAEKRLLALSSYLATQ